MEYVDFIARKRRIVRPMGFDVDPSRLNPNLFEWQRRIVEWALRRGRAAIFADTGLGKTIMELSWAEQVVKRTNLPVILHCPLGVRLQTKRESEKFAIDCDVKVVNEQSEVITGINLVNYDKLDHFDPSSFSGVVLGEASILKNMQGKTKRKLCEAYSRTPYRLSETATPAPNDHDELGSQSEFLGVSEAVDMRNRFFYHDSGDTGKWTLMPHARKEFWRWVAQWAICIGKPSDIGGDDSGYDLPPMNINWHCVHVDEDTKLDGMLFNTSGIGATSMHDEKRLSNIARAEKTSEIVATNTRDPWVIWCDTNYESDALKLAIPEAVEIRGSEKESVKEKKLFDFSNGDIRVFITKPTLTSHGMNWQHCCNTVCAGRTFSFEKWYQLMRRFYRFGQKNIVNGHVVYAESEDSINQSIARKQVGFDVMRSGMAEAMNEATLEQLGMDAGKKEYKPSVRFEFPGFLRGVENAVS
jgi:hypothetical protein